MSEARSGQAIDPAAVVAAASGPIDHFAVIALLASHRRLRAAPSEELEWLATHGTLEHLEPGTMIARKGQPLDALHVILSGRVSHVTDQGGTWRKVMTWSGGDVTGQLPYSRLVTPPGNTVVDEPTVLLRVDRSHLAAIPVACPAVTAELVHVMLDRARAFKVSDLQLEKMASLGKLAAGLAHELNNPASAATRAAQLVTRALGESDEASRALGATVLDPADLAVIDRVRAACSETPVSSVLSPLERADREEEIGDWLEAHGVDDSLAPALSDTEITFDLLDELADTLTGDKLRASLRWVAAGCTVRSLARDIERAASRVHSLVSAVKGFTNMDQAAAPEAVDLAVGLNDTLAVLGAKARAKSVALSVDVAPGVPRVRGFGGELNQIWANLMDNAIDAVGTGGRVTVLARADGSHVTVTVRDNGPGIPSDLRSRIFDPFFTTKPVGQGTGLGLDIVRRLVDRHDGRLDLESEPGRTEFRVVLPIGGAS